MKKKLPLILAAALLLSSVASAAPAPARQLAAMVLQTAPSAIRQLLTRALPDRGTEIARTGEAVIRHSLAQDGSAVLTSVRLSDGEVIQTMTVPMDPCDEAPEMKTQQPALWAETFGKTVTGTDDSAFWGEIGYYRYRADGTFTQVTDRAVLNWAEGEDGSVLAISHEPGRRTYYSGNALSFNPAGDELLRIAEDGAVETLLSGTPAHGLSLTEITGVQGDIVRVCHTYVMGMADVHRYEYAVEHGKLRALENTPGMGFSGFTPEEAAAEQTRLDAAGCGVGAP